MVTLPQLTDTPVSTPQSVIFAPDLLVGASSFAERLTLNVGFTGGEANRAVVETLLENMVNNLEL